MASLKVGVLFAVLLHAILFLSSPVHCDDAEDDLLQGINSYRTALKLPPLTKNDKAGCVADEVADKLQDRPCTAANAATIFQIRDYPDVLDKCGVNLNNTKDGVILPVCVPDLVPTLVLTNYTHTQHAKYLNDSRFTGAGVGSEDDWMVVVLSTNTQGGSFAGASRLLSNVGLALVLGMLAHLVCTN